MMYRSASRFGSLAAKLPLVTRGQRIGLLGGSFDPPHAAHVLISDIAMKRLRLDRVWWLVTPGNPLKAGRGPSPIEQRAACCRALVGNRRIVVTTLEAQLTTAYTAATISYLRQRAPGVAFVWLMGADGLAQFHRWYDWPGIFSSVPIAVVDRPGYRLRASASPAASRFARTRVAEDRAATLPCRSPPAWTLLSGPLSPLSSTGLRAGRKGSGPKP